VVFGVAVEKALDKDLGGLPTVLLGNRPAAGTDSLACLAPGLDGVEIDQERRGRWRMRRMLHFRVYSWGFLLMPIWDRRGIHGRNSRRGRPTRRR
jgi:hypothetical protein